MKTNATQFKNHFGEYLQKVYQEPIIVEKSGKPSAVLISYALFERLYRAEEDRHWGEKAEAAVKEGFLGPVESERRLRKYAERDKIMKTEDLAKFFENIPHIDKDDIDSFEKDIQDIRNNMSPEDNAWE